MKPWYQKKKVWAAILGALLPILTILFAPERVEMVERICLAIIEAGVAAGFIFAEASVDKADRMSEAAMHNNHARGNELDIAAFKAADKLAVGNDKVKEPPNDHKDLEVDGT